MTMAASRQPADRGPLSSLIAEPVSRAVEPRARLLEATIATVAYRGYERATVERIAQVANVPVAVFEEHFEHKQECFVMALDELLDELERRVVARLDRRTAWPERVRSGLQALLCALAENPDGARALLVESLGAGAVASLRYQAAVRLLPPLLEEGRFHCADPDHLPVGTAEALVGGILAILHRRAFEDRTGELPRLVGDLAYFALLPYLGHHRALVAAYARP
jgi:AcrR family transcriptional regulator